MSKIHEALKKYYGYDDFRMVQEKIINQAMNGNNVLGIMPTGGGKSVCFQIPAILKDGLTIVISPLISLMEDQVMNLKEKNINADTINSKTTVKDKDIIYKSIENNDLKMLFISPERAEATLNLLTRKNTNISQIVFDEAHCLSQWGHDFRPKYKETADLIRKEYKDKPIIALTATADSVTREDIQLQLDIDSKSTYISGFDRPNIHLSSIEKSGSGIEQIESYLKARDGRSGIIFAATRKEADSLHEELRAKGYNVGKYHASMTMEQREESQNNFMSDKVKIMIATTAFGMGIDKPDIRFVMHSSMPYSISNFAQEYGRAGRDGKESEATILYSFSEINKRMSWMKSDNDIRGVRRFQEVVDVITGNGCLRTKIASKFGENLSNDCGKCSSCDSKLLNQNELSPIDKNDFTKSFLTLLSKNKMTYTAAIETLIGSNTVNVRRFKGNKTEHHGKFKNDLNGNKLVIKDIRDFAQEIIYNGYIDAQKVYSGAIIYKISDKGRDIVNGNTEIEIETSNKITIEQLIPPKLEFDNSAKTIEKIKVSDSIIENQDLFNILLETRDDVLNKLRVNKNNYDDYIKKSDLILISNVMPNSRKELEDIDGIDKSLSRNHSTWILKTLDGFKKELETNKIDNNLNF